MGKLTKEEFIRKSENIHKGKDIYAKVEYKNSITPVCIICKEHGEYWMKPTLHLRGHRCPKCAKTGIKSSTNDFISKGISLNGNSIIYDKVDYVNSKTKVCLICPKHGEFWQTPDKHLQGQGCPICAKEKRLQHIEEQRDINKNNFIYNANILYNGKYDYSNIIYINNKTKIELDCTEHGKFTVTPIKHLNGTECPTCAREKMRQLFAYTIEEYITAANEANNFKYNYSLLKEYKNVKQYIDVICPIHGIFTTMAGNHLRGHGCPKCANETNIAETKLYEYIKEKYPIEIERQKKFKWLNGKSLDIYIPSMNIAVEYQGRQHFVPVSIYGGEKHFLKQKQRDIDKYNECKKHNIKLFYFSKEKEIPNEYLDIIYTEEEELLKAIISYNNEQNNNINGI